MKIKEMFEKDINRDIKGVIKVGQDDEENKFQELNEYVVTKELLKHFREFFKNYKKSIDYPTDEIGVWISGFFGSGKSHFLKILSYILEDKEVHGRRPIDFFKEDKKIKDPLIIADMEAATNIDTDVILFNIDAKNSSSDKKNAIMKVFVKVFNEMLGYSGEMPFLADFEKQLDSDGKYNDFKEEFKNIYGEDWINSRNDYYFITDKIIETIVNIGYMSKEAAQNWVDKAEDNYTLSIENFAKEINKYLNSKGKNHRIVFLVDEIGQFIGDDTDLMLNLQTITEQLGTACKGRAWIVVTSQQNIDDLMTVKGQDFSKIQGRFKIRLSFSSANVDEVIRRRILQKNEVAKNMLEADYPKKEALIKNLITFEDTAEMKEYSSAEDYAEVYPFIPYQFNLLQAVLTSIREHGASGKHLSEGERSMLALFKESAQVIEDEFEGAIISFNIFYNALDKFIDHTHRGVIIKASNNENLDDFDVEILKTLFMVKYVKEIKANIENITTLMIDNIDIDRISLKEKIEKSLNKLKQETLIQKNGKIYLFLTNEEQDINRAIKNEIVEEGDVLNEIGETIFEDIISFKKYNFQFNKAIDNINIGRQSGEIGLRIITPYYEFENLEGNNNSGQMYFDDNNQMSTVLKKLSEQNNEVILYLNGDDIYLDEIFESLQIKKFLTKKSTEIKEELLSAKREENNEKSSRIKLFLEEAIKTADIYISGRKVEIIEKNPDNRVKEALRKLVSKVYNKLSYMEVNPSEIDILNNIKETKQDNLIEKDNICSNALNDLERFIDSRNYNHINPTLKTIFEHFSKAPYGFKDEGIQWLVAKLFSQHRISLIKNAEIISLSNYNEDEIFDFITNKNYNEKILVSKKKVTPKIQIKVVKDVLSDVFSVRTSSENDEKLMDDFKEASKNKYDELSEIISKYNNSYKYKYPGKEVVEKADELFKKVNNQQNIEQFYKFVFDNEDEFLDIGDDLVSIEGFFSSNQIKIFENACDVYNDSYNKNKNFITDNNLKKAANEIKKIIDMPNPYYYIKNLPELCENFNFNFDKILKNKRKPIESTLNRVKKEIIHKIDEKKLNELETDVNNQFDELSNKLSKSKSISTINGVLDESEALKKQYYMKINNLNHSQDIEQPKINRVELKMIAQTGIEFKSEEEINIYLNKLKEELSKNLKGYDAIYLI
ncbi:hypothetical protein BGI41_00855 [Methanobrevibacter sp. 87.7]|uniref:BREX system P-loop protein BrxC n=1 Tax=Methanobrevibacter sp. 87.7 TaxID=387957 RepID=UPI000B6EF85A|nr:BREX system P-loop protein BrxC [Methanobrevibacter sp. 87.7]OWT33748.1 hypothetical protein BGI41_00855 [Methanobrevibacter sp. 87.7]